MAKNQAKPNAAKRRSLARKWPMMIVAFAAILFGGLTFDGDEVQAQPQPKAKAKAKAKFEPGKTSPDVKSLTNGTTIDARRRGLTKLIDQEINKRIQAEGAKSAGQCDDAEFVRRVYLDIVGVIPAADKVTAFLDSKDTNKRAKLIDELLADSRFGNFIGETWTNLMVPRESNNRALSAKGMQDWLAEQFNKSVPLNKAIYELITATGEVDKNPAGIYFVSNPTVDKITDNSTRMFLGVQLQCAQCHNHPFTDWKQTEYWAMAAFYMKTKVNGTPQAAAKKGTVLAVMENNKAPKKKNGLPESAKIVPPKFLQGETVSIPTADPARPVLAKWMTSGDNKFFARAMVNRFWYQMFGRGIVNPVDDMHDDNTPTHPALLATLTEQFKLHDFDVKYLIRAICNSDVYQRSSVSKAQAGDVEPDLYTRREMRVMAPEQMYDSLTVVLGNATGKDPKEKVGGKKGPQTPRAGFVNFFHVDEANPLEYQNGIPQALRMMNSPFTGKSEAIAVSLTRDSKTPAQAVERLYLAALSRRPTSAESERLVARVTRTGSVPRTEYGNLLWALLNSSEFVLNH